eukprot:3040940-Pyramimonas_sp.AAC.1
MSSPTRLVSSPPRLVSSPPRLVSSPPRLAHELTPPYGGGQASAIRERAGMAAGAAPGGGAFHQHACLQRADGTAAAGAASVLHRA